MTKMVLTQEVYKLFDDVKEAVSLNLHQLMQEVWLNWSHVGAAHDVKVNNIYKLLEREKSLHADILNEANEQIQVMLQQIEELKKETQTLSERLSVGITIAEYNKDTPLFEYKNDLEERISGYREQTEARHKEMKRLLEWQQGLTQQLGVPVLDLNEHPLPAPEELDRLRDHLQVLQLERDTRADQFLHLQIEIKDMMEKLQLEPQTKFQHVVVHCRPELFQVTDSNMAQLRRLLQDLKAKWVIICVDFELRERLCKLWDCLDEDQVYRDNFLRANPVCHPDTEKAMKAEIKRCDGIQRQKIQVLVTHARAKIKLMWDNIMYSDNQREEFVHFNHNIFTEDTLDLHNMYLEKITKIYNDHKALFELVKTREELRLKRAEIEARVAEPGRYNNRGGRLLEEEKQRKSIESSLTKVEAQLREQVTLYESRTGATFTVRGESLLRLMEEQKESRKADRHTKLPARNQALAPSDPALRSLATSPPGKRTRTAGPSHRADKDRRVRGLTTKAAVAKAENHSATVKRKPELGGAAAKAPKASGSILKRLNGIEENQICQSSMVPNAGIPEIICDAPEEDPAFTPKKNPREGGAMTPKTGKENLQHNIVGTTPKANLMYTPPRLDWFIQLNSAGRAAPRTPLGAATANVQRTPSTNNMAFKSTPDMIRTDSQTRPAHSPEPFV